MTRPRKAKDRKPANAFITTRKGFCYLTIKFLGRNHEMMRIRGYKIDPDEKRHMRRLYPEVAFDWKTITQQLAKKREACQRYRTRPRKLASSNSTRAREPLYGVYEPDSRTVYTNDIPLTAAGVGRLLDALLQIDRELTKIPSLSEPVRSPAKPDLMVVQGGKSFKPR